MSASRSFFAFLAAPRVQPCASCLQRLALRGIHGSSRRRTEKNLPNKAATPARDDSRDARLSRIAVENPLTPADFPRFSEEELERLSERYTPEQLKVIRAGEDAIDPADLTTARVRQDPWRVKYLDDFSVRRPTIDKTAASQNPEHHDPELRLKEDVEFEEDLASWAISLGEDASAAEWERFEENLRMTVGKEEAEKSPRDYNAPDIPVMTDPLTRESVRVMSTATENGDDEAFKRLSKMTGLPQKVMLQMRVKQLVKNRVVNQTSMGKVDSIYILTVAGNQNGWLGIGEAKSADYLDAGQLAMMNALRNMKPIARYENRTIYGSVKGKVSGTAVELYTRPPGFGIRCQEKIYEMCRCAGIEDLAARTLRSRNPMNTVKAAYQALMKQRIPEEVARGRGRKLIDVRKVYYAGEV